MLLYDFVKACEPTNDTILVYNFETKNRHVIDKGLKSECIEYYPELLGFTVEAACFDYMNGEVVVYVLRYMNNYEHNRQDKRFFPKRKKFQTATHLKRIKKENGFSLPDIKPVSYYKRGTKKNDSKI